MSSLSVLVDGGRRETVRVTPNTALREVIDEVCKRHKLDPAAHALRQERANAPHLDSSLVFRLSGLPSNCRLELVRARRATSTGTCRVGIQLDDGSRLIGTFDVGATLSDVAAWCDAQPELGGRTLERAFSVASSTLAGDEQLRATTLARLGATPGGSLLVRARRAAPALASGSAAAAEAPPAALASAAAGAEPSSTAEAMDVDPPPTAPPPSATPAHAGGAAANGAVAAGSAAATAAGTHGAEAATAAGGAQADAAHAALLAQAQAALGVAPCAAPPPSACAGGGSAPSEAAALQAAEREASGLGQLFAQRASLAPALRRLRHSTGGGDVCATACATLCRYLSNVIRSPIEPKFRQINTSNAAFAERIGRFDGGIDVLCACGFVRAGAELLELPLPLLAGEGEASAGVRVPDAQAVSSQLEALDGARQTIGAVGEAEAKSAAAAREAASLAQAAPSAPPTGLPFAPPRAAAPPPAPARAATGPTLTMTERRVAELRARTEAVRADASVERQPTLFRTTGRSLQAAIAAANALPDEFYEVGANDLASIMPASLGSEGGSAAGASAAGGAAAAGSSRARAAAAGGAGGAAGAQIQTKAMRELARLQSAPKYTVTVVRVRISADVLLQLRFHPQEPVGALARLLATEFLEPPDAPAPVTIRLNTTPPMRVLDQARSFAQQELVPAALVHASWEAPGGAQAGGAPPLALRPDKLGARCAAPTTCHARPARQLHPATCAPGPRVWPLRCPRACAPCAVRDRRSAQR